MATDIQNLGGFVWSIAEILRGDFKQSEYGKVILPFVVLRRLDCILEGSKDAVLSAAETLPDGVDEATRDMILFGAVGGNVKVYNLSRFTFDKLRGFPDGATVDEEGYLWSAEVYSGRLIRFDPNGVVDRIVGLPVQSTTSVIFGGPNLDIAYVTSMARPMGNAYHMEREAGCVFAVHGLGVRGLPEPRFAG